MRKRIVVLVSAFSAVSFAACGGSSSSGLGNPTIAIEDVPPLYAESACTAYDNCAGILAEAFSRDDDCTTRLSRSISDSVPALQDAIAAGTVTYHGDKMQACLDEIAARSCDELETRTTATCDAALDGTIEIGKDCTLSLECKGSSYCKFDGACPGTCTELGAVNDDCETNDQCDDHLVCDASSKCIKPAENGDACDGDSDPPCASGLVCLGGDRKNGTPGECMGGDATFVGKSGDDCNVLSGPLCASGLSCVLDDIQDGTLVMSCQDRVDSGDDCQIAFPDMCPDDEYCDASIAMRTGTCRKRPESGDACGASGVDATPSVCAAYAVCVNGTCRAMQRLGGSCDNDSMCYTANCIDGKCAAGDSCE